MGGNIGVMSKSLFIQQYVLNCCLGGHGFDGDDLVKDAIKAWEAMQDEIREEK